MDFYHLEKNCERVLIYLFDAYSTLEECFLLASDTYIQGDIEERTTSRPGSGGSRSGLYQYGIVHVCSGNREG